MAGAFSSAFSSAFDVVLGDLTITDTDILQKPVDVVLMGNQNMIPGKVYREYSGPNTGVTYKPSNIARRVK